MPQNINCTSVASQFNGKVYCNLMTIIIVIATASRTLQLDLIKKIMHVIAQDGDRISKRYNDIKAFLVPYLCAMPG